MRNFKALPPLEALRNEFDYDPDTGLLMRRTAKGLVLAGSINKYDGYLQVGFGGPGKLWSGHRLIWKWVTGDDPGSFQIDHINRIRHDNRFCNLRLVDSYEQMANRGMLRTNSTGFKGVHRYTKGSKQCFRSSINKGGKRVFLGLFKTAEEAHAAYIAAGGVP